MKLQASAVALATVTLLAVSACKPAPEPVADVRSVRSVTVAAAANTASNVYSGEVRARYETTLAFRVGGKLTERAVNIGERVRAGQLLARLDPTDLKLGAAAAAAQLAAAEAQLMIAKRDLARVRSLHEKGYASQGEMDRFSAQFDASKAQFQAASAERDQIDNQAGYSILKAGANGVITGVLAEAGQVVAAGQPVLQLAQEGEMEVAAAIPEDQVRYLREGMPVTVSLWALGDKPVAGTVRELSAAADPATRTYAVRVSVPKPPAAMRLRMTASLTVPLQGLPTSVHLPVPAMVTVDGKAGVWVVTPESSEVRFRQVEFAGVEGGQVLIASGLQPGEVVATAGASYLREGQKVRLLETAAVNDAH